MAEKTSKTFHIAMYPWFALGHITSFVHIANKLAERGHKVSFLLPAKTQHKVEAFNLNPNFLTFTPITVPHVEGLPNGAETTNDVPVTLHPLIMTAMDRTEPDIEALLLQLKPHFVFYDFTSWLPALTRKLGIKSVVYCTVSAATMGYLLSPERKTLEKGLTGFDLLKPPEGFPTSCIKLRTHEARGLASVTTMEFGSGVSFVERLIRALTECDVMGFKTCKEIEGSYCEYLGNQFKKPVIYAGPVIPESPNMALEEQWENLLSSFEDKTVIFCAFGSECVLKKDQFQELVLGLEFTGIYFESGA
ncbi:UDP-glucuronosyl/UDP-glucosyltransferase [Corchorus olitorius]|uniref:UDP-glucuronosyl/UDP-glucosyltransferase n=1 Tax=Corchorus olitorius TaxID=93759 RepID=A0A1R3JCT9_9ROSI|nr:UDP-glucuronosyl/UDP-glucosyltransferase [Corchorus olitorius]